MDRRSPPSANAAAAPGRACRDGARGWPWLPAVPAALGVWLAVDALQNGGLSRYVAAGCALGVGERDPGRHHPDQLVDARRRPASVEGGSGDGALLLPAGRFTWTAVSDSGLVANGTVEVDAALAPQRAVLLPFAPR